MTTIARPTEEIAYTMAPIPTLKMTTELEITPAMAEEWLRANDRNRPLNPSLAGVYARDMMAGNWQMNGETIKFSRGGRLLDGQHRLTAVVLAGVTVRSDVAFGLDERVFATIDAGKKRTMADVLSIEGEQWASVMGAALHTVWRYEHNALFVSKTDKGLVPTHAELEDVLRRNPGIRVSIDFSKTLTRLLGRGLAAGMHYLCAQRDPVLADVFFGALGSGENLSAGEPVLLLRNRLSENRASRAKLDRASTAKLVAKAWNYTRQGKPMKQLKLLDDDAMATRID